LTERRRSGMQSGGEAVFVFDRQGRACVVSNRCIYFRRKRLVADIVLYSMAENCKESGSLRRCRLTEADVGSLEHRSTLVTTRTDISHRYQSMHLASVTGTLTNACSNKFSHRKISTSTARQQFSS